MVLMYVCGLGPYVSRLVIGPLPDFICKFGTFGIQFFGMNTCFLAVAIGWCKVAFAYFYKSIPVMEDKFFATYIIMNAYLLSILGIASKALLDEKDMTIIDVSTMHIEHFKIELCSQLCTFINFREFVRAPGQKKNCN